MLKFGGETSGNMSVRGNVGVRCVKTDVFGPLAACSSRVFTLPEPSAPGRVRMRIRAALVSPDDLAFMNGLPMTDSSDGA